MLRCPDLHPTIDTDVRSNCEVSPSVEDYFFRYENIVTKADSPWHPGLQSMMHGDTSA
jgi:hypothetical protein